MSYSESGNKKRRAIRYHRRENGRCVQCDTKAIDGYVVCFRHLSMRRASAKARGRAYYHKRRSEGGCTMCSSVAEGGKTLCSKHLSSSNEFAIRRWRRLVEEVISAYGGKCACCGEDEHGFLLIDHVANDGAEHRKAIGCGSKIYGWAKRNKYPDNLQVLCSNCNYSKMKNGGVCIHKTNAKLSPLRLVTK